MHFKWELRITNIRTVKKAAEELGAKLGISPVMAGNTNTAKHYHRICC